MKNKKAYVIGSNTRKSLSPLIFNYWFSKYSICCEYYYKQIQNTEFNRVLKKILHEKNLCGLNVTNPFKEKVFSYLDNIDKHARAIGAVNCITIKNNKLYGTNTDWIGYGAALKEKTTKKDRTNKSAIIIGYGGAARAILYALLRLEYKKIYVFNRTLDRFKNLKNKRVETHHLSKINDFINLSSLIINTTPINIFEKFYSPRSLPLDTIISDIVYNPLETNFLNHFTNTTNKIYGISMLINQAIPCFESWFGIKPVYDERLEEIINNEINQ